ncbi:OB-fold domain-containing protein [Bradyrhizobium sp. LHD-71]|uniref:Zn-ribbon domain-containing OB-fold protein n=1 Tax=Bradyrhizobium sp. LHD-71 TaxID=3072141 RepID=UPI00280F73C1|nr:OB-fold domain-containing protein [Bradyrhizobium sp. LHD-71]MDQ8727422.1 OB-fold domain-containing protein [Bradyrhizobium sp. LHD-71]
MTASSANTATLMPELGFRRHLAEGRFMLLRSRSSGRTMFYPRVAMPLTGEQDLEWVQADGRGTVYSTTAISVRPPGEPYNVALIDLVEGPRLMSRVDGIAAQDVTIGMRVQARIVQESGQPLLVFVPAETEARA